MKKELKKLSDLKSLGFDYNPSKIFKDYFEGKLLKSFIKSNINDDEENNEIDDNLLLKNEGNTFNKEGYFSLYAGDYCYVSKKVSKLHSESYSCIMSPLFKWENDYEIKIDCRQCEKNEAYIVNRDTILFHYEGSSDDGTSLNDMNILEMEFIIVLDKYGNTDVCKINFVYTVPEAISTGVNEYKFKNSVKFVNENYKFLPYKFSGNDGYLEGHPLKLVFELDGKLIAFSEFIIPGKNLTGYCRDYTEEKYITDYLYGKDKSILFGEDFLYACKLVDPRRVKESVLYKIIKRIQKIGRFGTSSFKNYYKEEEWLIIEENTRTNKDIFDFIINMNIYIESKGSEINPQKSIYKVKINYINTEEIKDDENYNLILNIKYYYLKLDGKIIKLL